MNAIDTVERLRGIGFLDGIADEHLQQLAGIAKEVEFPAGKILFYAGEPATTVYFLIQGSLSLEMSAPGVGSRRIMTVEDGELFGWSPLLQLGRLTATTRSLKETTAIEFSAALLLVLFEESPTLGYEFMGRMARGLAERLSAKRMQLFQLFEAYGAQIPPVEEA